MRRDQFPSTRCSLRPCAALLLAWLAVCLAGHLCYAAVTDDLVILNMVVLPSTQPEQAAPAFNAQLAGFKAAIYAAGNTAAHGRTIRIEDVSNPDSMSESLEYAFATYGDTLIAATAPQLTDQVNEAEAYLDSTPLNLTMFNPYSSGFDIRRWTQNLYFTSADPSTELLAQIVYLVSVLRVKKIGFMYLSGIGMGEEELELAKTQLASSGIDITTLSIYEVPYVVSDTTYDTAAFDAFADTNPSAILYYASPGLHSLALCEAILTDSRTKDAYLLTPSMLLDLTYQCTSAVAATLADNQVIMSSTTVLASQTEYQHIEAFQKEMTACIVSSNCLPYDPVADATIFLDNPSVGQMLVYAWIGGKVMMETLMREDYVVSREAYQKGIFQINTAYVVGEDLLLGSYGGECPDVLKTMGNAQCECNQGGRSAYLKTAVVKDGAIQFDPLPDNTFTYSNYQCYSRDAYTVPFVIGAVVLDVTDDSRLHDVAELSMPSYTKFTSVLNAEADSPSLVTMHRLTTTAADMNALLEKEVSKYTVQTIIGPVQRQLDFASLPFTVLNPMDTTISPHRNDTNIIYLFPTSEQETFVIYSNLYNASREGLIDENKVSIIFKDVPTEYSESILATMKKVAYTLSLPEAAPKYVGADEPMKSYFSTTGADILIGTAETDIADMAQHLVDNPASIFFLCSQDFTRLYTPLIAQITATQDPTVMARVLVLTSMPIWTYPDEYTTSPMVKAFHATENDGSALAFRAFIELTFLRYVMALSTSHDVSEAVYDAGTITVNGMVFGPFIKSCQGVIGTSCTPTNYGATNIGGLSILNLVNPGMGYMYDPITPSIVYKDPNAEKKSGLSTGAIAGIIVACVVVVVGVIVLVVVLLCCCGRSSRDNKNAPKALEYPVTLIFTDIESSTALWAACPTIMPDAVATHHKLIRQLIAEYKCYEVKTIGDSFMIACKDANAAVRLARDVQVKFLKHDWKAPEIDDAYRSFEQRKEDEMEGYSAPTSHLSPDVYVSLWNGLRVRIGVHTGLSDIRQDETTHGFDYYGETSNMAARTEAIGNGGQVVLTESTWWALSDDERDMFDCRNMGPQGLRGVPFNVEMFQLNAVVGRRYAALRTEIDAILPDTESLASSDGTGALLSSADALTGPAANIAFVLTNTFAPYPVTRRVKELTPLLEKWSIGIPPRSRNVNEEDYCRGLINRLAVKMSTVVQMRNAISGTNTGIAPLSGTMRMGTYNVLSPNGAPPIRALSSDVVARSGELSANQVASLGYRNSSVKPLGVRGGTDTSPVSPAHASSAVDAVMPFRRTSMSVSGVNMTSLSVMDETVPEVELNATRRTRRSHNSVASRPNRSRPTTAGDDGTIFVRMPASLYPREESGAEEEKLGQE